MAIIESAQTGLWNIDDTWSGTVIPDPGVDDVLIASGHTVTLAETAAKFSEGRTITVSDGAKLIVDTCRYWDDDDEIWVYEAGLQLTAGRLVIEPGAELEIKATDMGEIDWYAKVFLFAGSALDLSGLIHIINNSTLNVSGDGTVMTIHAGGVLDVDYGWFIIDYSAHCVQRGGSIICSDFFILQAGAVLDLRGGQFLFTPGEQDRGEGALQIGGGSQVYLRRANSPQDRLTGGRNIVASPRAIRGPFGMGL